MNFAHYADDTKARGMWNGYGQVPNYSSEGVRIILRETDPSSLFGDTAASLSGSLLQKFFTNQAEFSKPIGKLPEDFEKSISECIVAIPYMAGNGADNPIAIAHGGIYSEDDDKYFFPIKMGAPTPGITTGQTIVAGESVKNLKEKMEKFVFPPRYDFTNNPNSALAPFAMYAFEFTHKFTRQELADIWQGVMPDISLNVIPETTTLSIPVQQGELMYELWSSLSDKDSEQNFILDTLNKNLRWMIFKVKQRAHNKYSKITKSMVDEGFTEKVADYKYSYNWPYDYCSLVEVAKVEAGIKMDKIPGENE